jgi:hypothetical protein
MKDKLHTNRASSYGSKSSQGVSETEMILYSVSSTISSLFQLSTLIRKATSRDRYMRAAIVATTRTDPFQVENEIPHVREKCPRLKAEGPYWLIERLAHGITLRREYLRYCEDHQGKLKPDSIEGGGTDVAQEDTIASSLKIEQLESAEMKANFDSFSPPAEFEDSRSQEPLYDSPTFDDSRSEGSSYASSIGIGEEESDYQLHLPTLGNTSKGLDEFECPFCHIVQNITQQRLWKYVTSLC